MLTKKIIITQSNYIPWKGYFDMIRLADEFLVYDDMQYTRRDWRNRNLIKTSNGLLWLTIPVEVSGKFHQQINETKVSEARWADKHWKTIEQNYSKAPSFREVKDFLGDLYSKATSAWLTEINLHFLTGICQYLGIKFNYRLSSEFPLLEDRNERLVALCQALGATDYYSGQAAKNYMNDNLFAQAGIKVNYLDYTGYPTYHQLHPPFIHQVSMVDLLLNEGSQSIHHLKNLEVST
jgi:WbqC-like protein family